MSVVDRLMRAYFNLAYNPVYDFTTARLNRYRQLQRQCVDKLELRDDDKLLCVGIGTGNEIFHILAVNGNVNIVGIDYSKTALQRAQKKALRLGKKIEVLGMDARNLEFASGSFEKVICLHVMDFIEDINKVTDEILRVLKEGGQFVITYPSDKEGTRMGLKLLSDDIRHSIESGKNRVTARAKYLAQLLLNFVYLPLLLRPKRKSYSRHELETMITQFTSSTPQVDEDSVYQDFIIHGRKITSGG
jgi:ubiquinone/menaquinone biosynthesis C-methylase UbiE